MRIEYKSVKIELENNDVYNLWDIICFALDHHAEHNCLNEEQLTFANKLRNKLEEF